MLARLQYDLTQITGEDGVSVDCFAVVRDLALGHGFEVALLALKVRGIYFLYKPLPTAMMDKSMFLGRKENKLNSIEIE